VNPPALTIVGPRINSSRKIIAQAIQEKNEALIQHEARIQHEAGAAYIDVNAGAFLEQEVEYLPWLVRTVQAAVDAPLWLDSADAEAVEAALEVHRGKAVINSITFEKQRMDAMVPLAVKHSCGIVGLTIDSIRVPTEAEKKCEIAAHMVEALTAAGIKKEDIFVDPVVMPVGVAPEAGKETLAAIPLIRAAIPGIHIVCGAGNVSFQLPNRALLEATYLAMAMAAGMDVAFLDPCNTSIMASIIAAEALLGKDEFCIRYISAYREGKLGKK